MTHLQGVKASFPKVEGFGQVAKLRYTLTKHSLHLQFERFKHPRPPMHVVVPSLETKAFHVAFKMVYFLICLLFFTSFLAF